MPVVTDEASVRRFNRTSLWLQSWRRRLWTGGSRGGSEQVGDGIAFPEVGNEGFGRYASDINCSAGGGRRAALVRRVRWAMALRVTMVSRSCIRSHVSRTVHLHGPGVVRRLAVLCRLLHPRRTRQVFHAK